MDDNTIGMINPRAVGRRPKERPAQFESLREEWRRGGLSAREAAFKLGVTHQTFLRWAREKGGVLDEEKNRRYIVSRQTEGRAAARARGIKLGRKPKEKPANFEYVREEWRRGEVTGREAAEMLGVGYAVFSSWAGKMEQAAKNARPCVRRRQAEGIALARARGVRLGRRPKDGSSLGE